MQRRVNKLAHQSTIKGRNSELVVMTALLANGWEVAEPVAPESYDLVARAPDAADWVRIQVRTANVRRDRDNAIVVSGRKKDGKPFTPDDCEYIAGVLDDTVYLIECIGQSEYWATSETAQSKWLVLQGTVRAKEAV